MNAQPPHTYEVLSMTELIERTLLHSLQLKLLPYREIYGNKPQRFAGKNVSPATMHARIYKKKSTELLIDLPGPLPLGMPRCVLFQWMEFNQIVKERKKLLIH